MIKMFLHKNGFILFSVLAASLVLIIIIAPLISWTVNEYSWTTRSFNSLRALNLADAGAELAIWDIVHNEAKFNGWQGSNPKTLMLYSFTDNLGEAIGDVSISVLNTSPDHYLITSQGFVPTLSEPLARKTVKVKVFPHALFNNGVFGYNSVRLSGNALVDSYDSTSGPYSELTAGNDADVGTNGAMTFLENSQVNGDIFVGPNGSVSGDIPTHVNGEDYYTASDVELGNLPDYGGLILLSSEGNKIYGGQTIFTLPSGQYRYESLTVEGQASVTISSHSRIYIHNDFSIAGQAVVITNEDVEVYIMGNGIFAGQGIVNSTGEAKNLEIYGVGSGTTLSYTGQNDFYGTIFAPYSSIYMAGDADVFGAIVGKDVELAGNIKFHYDEDLKREGAFVGYDIAYWQED